jgi:SPOR domain
MADNTNLGSAGNPAIDDDPFAELTRIMGFDPREPVKPAAAASPLAMSRITAIEPEPIQVPVPDLAIDLERELMGDFLDDEESAEKELRLSPADPTPGDMVATAAADLDDIRVEEAEEAARASNWFRPDEAEADHSVRMEPEFDGQDDAAVEMPVAEARPMVELPLTETEMFADAEPTQPETSETAESETAVSESAWGAVDDVKPEAAAVHAGADTGGPEAFVEAREPWFEPEVSGFDDWVEVPVEAAARSDEIDLSEVSETAEQTDEGGYEVEFDMPPVEAAPAPPVELIAEEDSDEAPIGDRPTQADYDHDQAVAAARAYLARQAMAREADASVSAEEPDIAPAAAAPADAHEISLEEELNALLGNIPVVAKNPAIDKPAAVASPSHPVAVADASIEPEIDVPNLEPAGAHADQEALLGAESIDDDLDGLFDNGDFDAAISSAVEANMKIALGEPAIATATRNDLEVSMARSGHDPYAALSALSAGLKSSQGHSDIAAIPSHASASAPHAAYQREQMPEIETVDVHEPAIALADDLDLPEVVFEPEPRAISQYDDIDTEFSNLLNTMAAPAAATVSHQAVLDTRYRGYATPAPAPSSAAPVPARTVPQADDAAYPVYANQARPVDLGTVSRSGQASNLADMEFAYDPDVEEEMASPGYAAVGEPKSKWRRYGIIGTVGVMALVGALGAYAVSFGGSSGSQEVALVKADPSPVKVKPENPGGATVATQDSTVYDSARGEADTTPTQEKLLTSAEEPAPMPIAEDESEVPMMGADDVADAEAGADEIDTAGLPLKGDDRLAEQDGDGAGVDSTVEVAAVAPRKVRTMIVKADGTLVAREETAPEAAVDPATEGAVDPMASNAVPDQNETTATDATAESEAAPVEQETAAVAQPSKSAGTPETAPIAPARPADQPVDIVGRTKADQQEQVASIDPAAAEPVAVPAGTYSMQIASQPTQESAQASFNSLSRKYASVLDGRQARIVEADIAGKGKYWRVQVPVGSRKDAIKLCESYKSAGGSCFVSK